MEKQKEGWKQFIEICRKTQDNKNLTIMFDLLLTPEEKEDIAMRCLIIKELLEKKAHPTRNSQVFKCQYCQNHSRLQ